MEKQKLKAIYASVKNDHIAAIIAQSFRFASEEQAKSRLKYLEGIFIKPKQQLKNPEADVLILWIEGYDVSEAQGKKGCTGNFAAITYKNIDNKFTLYPTKMEVDLKLHPQRKRVKSPHPNWGHPILRWVKSKKFFATLEEAQKLLNDLHEEYPTTSIPLGERLNIMVYSKGKDKNENPIRKYVLSIQRDDGRYYIAADDKKEKPQLPKPALPAEEPSGKFTQMVIARRARKKRK